MPHWLLACVHMLYRWLSCMLIFVAIFHASVPLTDRSQSAQAHLQPCEEISPSILEGKITFLDPLSTSTLFPRSLPYKARLTFNNNSAFLPLQMQPRELSFPISDARENICHRINSDLTIQNFLHHHSHTKQDCCQTNSHIHTCSFAGFPALSMISLKN